MTVNHSATSTSTIKPPSSTAQKIIAAAAVLIALLIVVGGVIGWMSLVGAGNRVDRMSEGLSDITTPRAVQQAICLPYSDFVLRQHQAGLTPQQMQGVLDYAGHDGEGDAVDSTGLCGSPKSVLDAAGIK